jgi:uncharacterized tellurite resistance protein B-like protein
MSIWDRLGFSRGARVHADDTDTIRRIAGELEQLDESRARYLAAFAYILSRVAAADLDVSEAETKKITEIVKRLGHLSDDQAVLVAAIAKNQSRVFGGTEDFLVTRVFRQIATDEQRRELLDCLFAVSAADETITADEEAQIRQIASELGFEHQQFIQARLTYSARRSLFKGSDDRTPTG